MIRKLKNICKSISPLYLKPRFIEPDLLCRNSFNWWARIRKVAPTANDGMNKFNIIKQILALTI